MPGFLGILLAAYLAAVAETALAPLFTLWGVSPSLLILVGILGTMLVTPSAWRVPQMSLVGLVFDLHGGGHVGVGMFSFALLTFVLASVRASLRRLGALEQALFTMPLAAVTLLLIVAGNIMLRHSTESLPQLAVRALAAAAYTAALSLPVWLLLAWRRESRRTLAGSL